MEPSDPMVLTATPDGAKTSGEDAESSRVNDLVERAKGGEEEAFCDLMRLYERQIIALGLQMGLGREDARDACQETFVKVFRYIGRFESGRSFFKWLYRIAINSTYDQLRRARAHQGMDLEELDSGRVEMLCPQGPTLHDRLESSDLADKVRKGLACLTKRERIVFVLRDIQDLKSEEIGLILGLSQVTVRRHCMSARQKLRALLVKGSA